MYSFIYHIYLQGIRKKDFSFYHQLPRIGNRNSFAGILIRKNYQLSKPPIRKRNSFAPPGINFSPRAQKKLSKSLKPPQEIFRRASRAGNSSKSLVLVQKNPFPGKDFRQSDSRIAKRNSFNQKLWKSQKSAKMISVFYQHGPNLKRNRNSFSGRPVLIDAFICPSIPINWFIHLPFHLSIHSCLFICLFAYLKLLHSLICLFIHSCDYQILFDQSLDHPFVCLFIYPDDSSFYRCIHYVIGLWKMD